MSTQPPPKPPGDDPRSGDLIPSLMSGDSGVPWGLLTVLMILSAAAGVVQVWWLTR